MCCPFHGEDTPSFVVSPEKQIYHCFGCGTGGDAIKFIQEYNKLEFADAVEHIARYLNFKLTYDNERDNKDYSPLLESINHFYENNLKDEKLKYLLDRGISKKSIKDFELGYSSITQNQIKFLNENLFNLDDAVDVGVLAKDKDRLYARQHKRITFPIRNHANKIIGFGGRSLENKKNIAKYINSPQTKLFNKATSFYGISHAKNSIYKKKTMVICEGYLDVVMLHQANVKTAVATMGTALTKEHIPIIKKYDCRVLLCFDGDDAGKSAAFKASMLLSQSDIECKVVIFQNGVDPADMVKDNQIEQLYHLLKNPMDGIKYILNIMPQTNKTI